MKTVKELTVEHHLNRSTVLKAAQQGRIPARQSGKTWLIDEESEGFRAWLTGALVGRPRMLRNEAVSN